MLRLPRIVFSASALVALLIGAAPANADAPSGPKLVPFHATAAGPFSLVVAPPNRFVTAFAEGEATHLGRFEVVTRNIVNLTPVVVPNCATLGTNEIYSSVFTGANGDTITLAGTGTGCPTSATTVVIMDTATVTGGTGRFEGASGTITVHADVDRATLTAVDTYDGTLSTPGSLK